MCTAALQHLGKKLLKLVGFRSGIFSGQEFAAYHIAIGAHKADFCVQADFKKVLDQISRGSLAICSRNADHRHFGRRVAEKVSGTYGKCPTAVLHKDIWNLEIRRLLADDAYGATLNRGGDIPVAIGLKTLHGKKQAALFHFSGIVINLCNLHVKLRTKR